MACMLHGKLHQNSSQSSTQTNCIRSPDALSALTDWTSRCSLPSAPSPQNSTRWILESFEAVGQTLLSSAQVVVCSPVADDHLSLNVLNGILTSTKSSPAGTENLFLKQPRLNGSPPPPAQAKSGLSAPLTKVTR